MIPLILNVGKRSATMTGSTPNNIVKRHWIVPWSGTPKKRTRDELRQERLSVDLAESCELLRGRDRRDVSTVAKIILPLFSFIIGTPQRNDSPSLKRS